jgi:tryptophan-rich sensory protein
MSRRSSAAAPATWPALIADCAVANGTQHEEGVDVNRERALKILLALVGLFFVAGIYPLITSVMQRKQSDYPDQMILAIYVTLGVFLLLAIRNPAANRSLIAFTGWSSLAHAAVMAVQSLQLGNERTELPPLGVVGVLCVILIVLTPTKQSNERAPASV